MISALMVTQATLLVLIVLLALLLLATVRQVGILSERIAPLGALTLQSSLRPGELVPSLSVKTTRGASLVLGGPRVGPKSQLLLFISPDCPMCKQLLDSIPSFLTAESNRIELVLLGDGSVEAHETLLRKKHLSQVPLVVDRTPGVRYQVAKLPYGMLIDPTGTLRSAGLINSREHLESLVVALETGVGSVQEYLHARKPSAEQPFAGGLTR